VIEPVLPLREYADLTPSKSMATDPAPVGYAGAADPAPAESSADPLHSVVGVALTETSWLYNLII
jgi:hypothetical protein